MALDIAGTWPDQAERQEVVQALEFLVTKRDAWRVQRCLSGKGYVLVLPSVPRSHIHADSVHLLWVAATVYYKYGAQRVVTMLQAAASSVAKVA